MTAHTEIDTMSEARSTDHASGRTRRDRRHRESPPIELWRLRGATDELRGLAFETSFGYALGLELDAELVLLHLQPTLDTLVAYADRIQSALQAQGWALIEDSSMQRSRYAAR
jgi:hypothetical protein